MINWKVKYQNLFNSPEPSEVSNYGWLSPDGLFYSCPHGGHSELAERICELRGLKNENSSYHLERRNWIHKTNGVWSEPFSYPTQRQLDVLLPWELENWKIPWMRSYR